MTPQLKTNVARLRTNFSTYAAIALAVLGYLGTTGATSLQDLIDKFSPQTFIAFLVGLLTFLVTRVLPQYADAVQTPAPAPDAQEPPRDE